MTRFIRLGSVAAAAALAVTVAAGPGAALAAASGQLPTDPAAQGYIGLCNQAGQNVTGGSTKTRPFVWTAVASQGPPASYQGRGQTAVLGIVQPRTGTGPDEWNGAALTSPSFYRDRRAPAAQATYHDESLASFAKTFPAQVDGLYVLRMYFGKINYADYSETYPTTTIQVRGSHWRVVQGGTIDCGAAKAESNEQLTGSVGRKATTPGRPSPFDQTVSTKRERTISQPILQVSGSSLTSVGGGGSRSVSERPTSPNSVSAADTSKSSSLSWVVWALVVIVIALVAALGSVLRSRRFGSSRS